MGLLYAANNASSNVVAFGPAVRRFAGCQAPSRDWPKELDIRTISAVFHMLRDGRILYLCQKYESKVQRACMTKQSPCLFGRPPLRHTPGASSNCINKSLSAGAAPCSSHD